MEEWRQGVSIANMELFLGKMNKKEKGSSLRTAFFFYNGSKKLKPQLYSKLHHGACVGFHIIKRNNIATHNHETLHYVA
jgi:hypothetical protein